MKQEEKEMWESKYGWQPRFGQGSLTEAEANESLLDHATFLETKLEDKFFGGTLMNLYKYLAKNLLMI